MRAAGAHLRRIRSGIALPPTRRRRRPRGTWGSEPNPHARAGVFSFVSLPFCVIWAPGSALSYRVQWHQSPLALGGASGESGIRGRRLFVTAKLPTLLPSWLTNVVVSFLFAESKLCVVKPAAQAQFPTPPPHAPVGTHLAFVAGQREVPALGAGVRAPAPLVRKAELVTPPSDTLYCPM